jgi:hypothetical protein
MEYFSSDHGHAGNSRLACSVLKFRICLRQSNRTKGHTIAPSIPVIQSQIALSLGVIPVDMFYVNFDILSSTFNIVPTNS